jgi:hypothetical protein
MSLWWFIPVIFLNVGRHSSVGIAIRYGLDVSGIETRWRRVFPDPFRPDLGPTQLTVPAIPGFSRGQSGRGVALTTHPHLAPRLRKEYSYTFTPPLGFRGLFQGEMYLLSFNIS